MLICFLYLLCFVADKKSEVAFKSIAMMLRSPPKRGKSVPQPVLSFCADLLHMNFEANFLKLFMIS